MPDITSTLILVIAVLGMLLIAAFAAIRGQQRVIAELRGDLAQARKAGREKKPAKKKRGLSSWFG